MYFKGPIFSEPLEKHQWKSAFLAYLQVCNYVDYVSYHRYFSRNLVKNVNEAKASGVLNQWCSLTF